MISYYVGQLFRVLWYIFLPGMIMNFTQFFFLDKQLIIGIVGVNKGIDPGQLLHLYEGVSIILAPLALVLYLLIRRFIYQTHYNDAYRKQLSGKYSKDKSIWDDSNWNKP